MIFVPSPWTLALHNISRTQIKKEEKQPHKKKYNRGLDERVLKFLKQKTEPISTLSIIAELNEDSSPCTIRHALISLRKKNLVTSENIHGGFGGRTSYWKYNHDGPKK